MYMYFYYFNVLSLKILLMNILLFSAYVRRVMQVLTYAGHRGDNGANED